MSDLLYDREGDIRYITINRPQKANALSPEVMRGIVDHVREAEASGAHVVIVRGAGKGFSAGHDISPTGAVASSIAAGSPLADRDRLASITRGWLELWEVPVAVIAQVHGYCLAGAVEFTMFCDLVLAAEDTRFSLPAIRGTGGSPPSIAYPFYVGVRRTKEYLWLQEEIDGRRAEEWGLVNRAVAPERLEEETARWAKRISMIPRENIRLSKTALHRAMDIIGFRAAVQTGSEFDALAHTGPASAAWNDLVSEVGLPEAIRMRDAPFG